MSWKLENRLYSPTQCCAFCVDLLYVWTVGLRDLWIIAGEVFLELLQIIILGGKVNKNLIFYLSVKFGSCVFHFLPCQPNMAPAKFLFLPQLFQTNCAI